MRWLQLKWRFATKESSRIVNEENPRVGITKQIKGPLVRCQWEQWSVWLKVGTVWCTHESGQFGCHGWVWNARKNGLCFQTLRSAFTANTSLFSDTQINRYAWKQPWLIWKGKQVRMSVRWIERVDWAFDKWETLLWPSYSNSGQEVKKTGGGIRNVDGNIHKERKSCGESWVGFNRESSPCTFLMRA